MTLSRITIKGSRVRGCRAWAQKTDSLTRAVVMITVGFTVPVVTVFVLARDFDETVAERLAAPDIQLLYGFSASRVSNGPNTSSMDSAFQIVSVVPGGAFDQAGVRPGDVPTAGFQHGTHASSFYGALSGRDGVITIRFYRAGSTTNPYFARIRVPE